MEPQVPEHQVGYHGARDSQIFNAIGNRRPALLPDDFGDGLSGSHPNGIYNAVALGTSTPLVNLNLIADGI
jgi:hypothetical protein